MNGITFEETSIIPPSHTISEALGRIRRDPALFIKSWNYKGAVLSGLLRAPIFFITYLVGRESIKLALGAALLQFTFRFAFAGVGGTLIQSFRRVEPAWKALLAIMLIIPFISHLFEFTLQACFAYLTGTQDHTDEAILRSITVSIISALFTLFAMRRNVMIVGDEESRSLLHDIWRLPRLVFEFVAFIPNDISAMLRQRAYIRAVLGIIGFGMFSQFMVSALTSRLWWTYGKGRAIPLLQFWGVDGMILLIMAVVLSSIVYSRSRMEK
ncbi:MAG TPA: hypothetical protein VK468_08390 [Pyrinomonadaceae bacterium]|nr:hypothetical protein [Pyrinomonadaceae bacterium]